VIGARVRYFGNTSNSKVKLLVFPKYLSFQISSLLSNISDYNLLYGFVTPLPFEMATVTSPTMKNGLPQSINATSKDATNRLL
jgi:hypothetical protein